MTQPIIHALNPMTRSVACDAEVGDLRLNASPYGSDVNCEDCRATWRPETRAAIDKIRADQIANAV